MSDNETKETIADKAKKGLATAAMSAKEQLGAFKTKEGREALKDKIKKGLIKAKDYLLALRTKEGRQTLFADLKAMTMKQKAVFGATAICLLIIVIGLLKCGFSSSPCDLNRNT